eukprot:2174803-Alexandrium_andersonii.AAC.1
MPARPVPDDDGALVRRAVEGRPPQSRPYEGQLPPAWKASLGRSRRHGRRLRLGRRRVRLG